MSKQIKTMAKNPVFLKDQFIKDVAKKGEEINEEIIAGKCKVTSATVRNWADPTQGSVPSLSKGRILSEIIGITLDEFVKTYIR